MNKVTFSTIIKTFARCDAKRAEFLQRVAVKGDAVLEVSGTSKGYNYGDTCEALLKVALGLNGTKEQGKRADIHINGIGYDVKAVDNSASATKGHNTDTAKTLIIANMENYKGVYEIENRLIEWTASGKMKRLPTLRKAKLNKELTAKLLRA